MQAARRPLFSKEEGWTSPPWRCWTMMPTSCHSTTRRCCVRSWVGFKVQVYLCASSLPLYNSDVVVTSRFINRQGLRVRVKMMTRYVRHNNMNAYNSPPFCVAKVNHEKCPVVPCIQNHVQYTREGDTISPTRCSDLKQTSTLSVSILLPSTHPVQ